jgi:autotransporter-associated beta strand protein
MTLGTDNILNSTSGAINFGSTVDSANTTARSLTLNTSGTTTFNGTVGNTNALNILNSTGTGNVIFDAAVGTNSQRLASISINGATQLNGGTVYTIGAQTYTGAVTLGVDNILDSTSGAINFASTVDSASTMPYSLTLNTTGTTTFSGAVGNTYALNILSSTGTGNVIFDAAAGTSAQRLASININGATQLNGGTVYTSGNQTYTGAVTLATDNLLDSTSGATNFASTVDSASTTPYSLTLNTTGTTTFSGAVGNTNALNIFSSTGTGNVIFNSAVGTSLQRLASISINGATQLNGGTVYTSGNQTYTGAVTLNSDNLLNSTSGAINFGSTVDSANITARSLTLNTSGTSTFTGTVGNTYALNALSSTGTGNVIFDAAVGTSSQRVASININGATQLNGSTVYTNGAQTYTGAVTLGVDNSLDANAGTITFNSTVDSASNTLSSLTLNASDASKFNGAVGVINALNNLTVNNTTILNAGTVTTVGNQTYTGVVTMNTDNVLNAGTGTINFGSTIDSANSTVRSLTLNTSGATTFTGAIGNTHTLNVLSSTGSGMVIFDSAVGTSSQRLASISINGATQLNGGAVYTTGPQMYNGAVTLGIDNLLNSTSGAITFNSTVDSTSNTPYSLTLNTSNSSTFNGAVGNTYALNILNSTGTGNVIFNNAVGTSSQRLASISINGATQLNGSTVYTSGAQTYTGAVTLNSDDLLDSTSGAIKFNSTVDSSNATARSLTVNTSGTSTFNAAVGNTNALNVLSSTGTGSVVFNAAVGTNLQRLASINITGATLFNGNTVYTSGNQTYTGAVTLNTDNLLNSTSGAINFGSTVDSANTTARSLTLNTSGTTTFNGAVGNTYTLNNLSSAGTGNVVFNSAVGSSTQRLTSININGATQLNGATVYTSGTQTYNGAVTLGTDDLLNASSGTINFNSTLDSASSTTPSSLTLNTPNTTTFSGTVGNINALNILNSTGTGNVIFSSAVGSSSQRLASVSINGVTQLNGGSVYTNGNQTYKSAVSLGTDNLLDANTGTVNFNTTVDSSNATARSLTINTSGTTTFTGTVGNTYALNNLSSTGIGTVIFDSAVGSISQPIASVSITGASQFNGGTIVTSGNQNYTGAVTLGVNNTLTSTSGGITLASTVNNNGFNLTIDAATLSKIIGVMSGTGNLIVNDNGETGILQLDSANAYTGLTEIENGTLQLVSAEAIPEVSVTTINGGSTLDLNGYSEKLDNLSGSGTIKLGSLSTTNLIVNNIINEGFSGTISGTGNFVKKGTGTYTLSGSNSYIGNTNVDAGILSITNSNALGTLGSNLVTVHTNAELDMSNNIAIYNNLNLYGSGTNGVGALQATGQDFVLGNVNVNATNGTDTQISALGVLDQLTIQGLVTGNNLNINNYSTTAGAGAVGTVELANLANTYTGNTNVFSGTLLLDGTTSINTNTDLNLLNNSFLEYKGVTNITIAALSGTGSLNLNGLILTTGDSESTLFSGTLIGSGDVIKVGTGTLTLNGTNAFTGNTTVSAGVLNFASNATLGAVKVTAGGTLELTNSAATAQSVTLNGTGTGNIGAMISSGISSLSSPIKLTTSSSIAVTSGTLTLNGNINADSLNQSGLTFSGAGGIVINGSVGNTSRLNSFTTSNTGSGTTINGSGVATTGNQSYNNPLVLADNNTGATSTLDSSNGYISANTSIDGAVNLTVNSVLNTTFNGAIGLNTALTSLTTNAMSTGINGGTIITTGSQTYNNPVTLGKSASLSMTSDGTLTMMNGISSPNNLTVNGNGANYNNFMLGGGISLNNLNINTGTGNDNITLNGTVNINNVNINSNFINNGMSTSNNTLSVLTDSLAQNWSITSANGGSINGVATNMFNFNNIQNIAGGNNTNNFTLAGGTLAGTVTGGTGNNTLNGDNVNNNFNITGMNSGSATGIAGFSSIQNLVGGNVNNTFTFYNNSYENTINGGSSMTAINTLNYANYNQGLNITINAASGGFSLTNSSNIMNFQNINYLSGNGSAKITIAGSGTNVVHITGATTGYINDPINYTGFNTIASASTSTVTKIVFDTTAIFNYAQGTAQIGSNTITLFNIPAQNISGDVNLQNNPAQNAAIISSLNAVSTIGVNTPGNSGNGSGSSLSITDNSDGSGGSGSSGSGGGSSTTSTSTTKVSTNCS